MGARGRLYTVIVFTSAFFLLLTWVNKYRLSPTGQVRQCSAKQGTFASCCTAH